MPATRIRTPARKTAVRARARTAVRVSGPPRPAPLPVMRVGLGFDIHPLVSGRPLKIGGIEIPAEAGPEGHSDGDPLLHAITDALLGAAGLGDIGTHFSDRDPCWKDAASSVFVTETMRHLQARDFEVVNLDCNLILERPKLAPFIQSIRRNVAALMDVSVERVSVKAKRHEGLDSLGRAEAIAAQVVVLLVRR